MRAPTATPGSREVRATIAWESNKAGAGLAHGGEEVTTAVQGLFKQVGDGFGVGLALEGVAAFAELGAEGGVVLDDAVVNDDDIVPGAGVRMRVRVAGGAVRGPAGVADAGARGGQRLRADGGIELGDLAAALGDGGLAPGLREEGDAGRVVAAVFEVAQAGQQDGRGLTRAGVGG